jgi:diadenosine tetraphosphate (Ap4A) HIT family hydrolase
MTKKNTFVDLDNARVDEQRAVMAQIIKDNHCPFCLTNLKKYHTPPIIKETKDWLLTTNRWPYKNTKYHLLIIHKKHKEMLSELTAQEGAQLVELLKFAQQYTQAPGGGFAMRFGDTNYSAGTIKHLHAQFIVPDINAPDFKPTRFKIGKDKEKRTT